MIYPRILSENAQGISAVNIEDSMLKNREIMLDGTVDHEQVASLVMQLMHLARADPDSPVTMYVNSPGGIITEGMTLYDVMQAVPCPINTVCTGLAASMAALIFAVGDHRLMLPHSKVMVHEPYTTGTSGSMFDLENSASNLRALREDYCRILAGRTGRSLDELYEAIHKETYFTPEEAIAFGLCDGVVERL